MNSTKAKNPLGFRMAVVGVTVACLFAALFARLYFLQVINYRTYEAASDENSFRVVCEAAPRGRILDRNGAVLVGNKIANAVTLARNDKSTELLQRVSALFNTPVPELEKRMADQRFSPLRPIVLVPDVPIEKIIFIEENPEFFKGLQVQTTAEREYPRQRLASHLLGYVGPIGEDQVKDLNKGATPDIAGSPEAICDQYRATDGIGRSGIEAAFEKQLKGKAGVSLVEVNNKSKVVKETQLRAPVQGQDIFLALDANLQEQAERHLKSGLELARTRTPRTGAPFYAPAGSVVVQDPNNGQVLAMASYPDYLPSEFTGGISSADYRRLNDNPDKPLINRAVSGLYAPASTFKLITASAALRHGVTSPNRTIVDAKPKWVIPAVCSGKCEFKNSDGKPAGNVQLQRAITISNDVYFYQVGWEFFERRNSGGTKMVQDEARLWGLGKKTGIPIAESNLSRVTDPEILAKRNKENPKAYPEKNWRPGDSINLAIGQGDTIVTPLQINGAYGVIANGGQLWQPQVVVKTQAPGQPEVMVDKVLHNQVPLDPTWVATLRAGFRGAVADQNGTAYQIFRGKNMSVAGKTGTAETPPKADTALFTSWAPFEHPQFSVTVVLEEAGFGGESAAPVAECVYEYLLRQNQDCRVKGVSGVAVDK